MLKTRAYAYDSFGNLSAITTNGTPRDLAVDGQTNRISVSGYDAAGSMTSWGDGGTTYSYACDPTREGITVSSRAMAGDLTTGHERRRCATVVRKHGTAAVARGRWIVSGEALLASRQYAYISNASIINRAKLFHFVRMRAAHPEERVGRGQQQ